MDEDELVSDNPYVWNRDELIDHLMSKKYNHGGHGGRNPNVKDEEVPKFLATKFIEDGVWQYVNYMNYKHQTVTPGMVTVFIHTLARIEAFEKGELTKEIPPVNRMMTNRILRRLGITNKDLHLIDKSRLRPTYDQEVKFIRDNVNMFYKLMVVWTLDEIGVNQNESLKKGLAPRGVRPTYSDKDTKKRSSLLYNVKGFGEDDDCFYVHGHPHSKSHDPDMPGRGNKCTLPEGYPCNCGNGKNVQGMHDKHFVHYLKTRMKEKYQPGDAQILDLCSSHYGVEHFKAFFMNKVVPLYLPPKTAMMVSVLDRGFFALVRAHWLFAMT